MVTLLKFQKPESCLRRLTTQHDDDKLEVATTMCARTIDYPCAIADFTDEGAEAALQWALDHKRDGEELTLWAMAKGTLQANDILRGFSRHKGNGPNVAVGKHVYRVKGPVLAMYPDAENLAYPAGAVGLTALAVVASSYELDTWAAEVKAEVIHSIDSSGSDTFELSGITPEPALVPEVIAGLKQITILINHNNTIAAGYERDQVVKVLRQLKRDGYDLPAKRMAEWAVAHGWRRGNPKELIDLAKKINNGVRPRYRSY